MPFYAVAKGRSPGVYNSWDECKSQTEKFSGATFKKFNTEAECRQYIADNGGGSGGSSGGGSGGGGSYSRSYNEPSYSRVPNAVAERSLRTEPVKFGPTTARTSSFTVPERNPSVDRSYLADLGKCIKRESQRQHDTRSSKIGRYDFQADADGFVQVYTDGSCFNNGQRGAKAGLGVYFGDNHPLNKSEPVRGKPTNNSGEIQAAIQAINLAKEQGVKKLCINTDSQFVINAVTSWMPGWKAKNWKLSNGDPVKNEVDFKELDRLYRDTDMTIKWNYVKAHDGAHGNEQADQLAKAGADQYNPSIHSKRT